MSQWCVESYPSSLYKFEIFSKLMFLAFWRNSGRGQGGPNPCLAIVVHAQRIRYRAQTIRIDYR